MELIYYLILSASKLLLPVTISKLSREHSSRYPCLLTGTMSLDGVYAFIVSSKQLIMNLHNHYVVSFSLIFFKVRVVQLQFSFLPSLYKKMIDMILLRVNSCNVVSACSPINSNHASTLLLNQNKKIHSYLNYIVGYLLAVLWIVLSVHNHKCCYCRV